VSDRTRNGTQQRPALGLAKPGFCLQLISVMSEPHQLIAVSQFPHL